MYRVVSVALAHDAALALLQIAGPPGAVQVVKRGQPVLHVGSGPHLLGAAHQHPYLTGTHFGEQLLLFDLGIGLMDVRNLAFGNPSVDQLLANIVVDSEAPVLLGGGDVTENELGQLVC